MLRFVRNCVPLPVLLAVLGLVAATAAPSRAQDAPGNSSDPPEQSAPSSGALKRLSIEELARISVVSASRHSEPVAESAASLTVVTGDAIRRAGARTLPDALRLVVGMDVAQVGRAWAVSARGFNSTAADKMVVLIDGRSVYTPLFSGVFWDAQDLVMADVDRIEVIRGAGGTLWGANAVNGVVNIITKLASDTQGALVQLGAGSDYNAVVARYGGQVGGGQYRVYGKYRDFDPVEGATEDSSSAQFGFRFDKGATALTSVTFQGDGYTGNIGNVGTPTTDLGGGNLLGRVRHTFPSGSQLQVQGYYDFTTRTPPQYSEDRHTGDAELQFRVSAGKRHDLVVGTGYSATHDRVEPSAVLFFDPPSRTRTLLNVFAQDEMALTSTVTAILGSKFEHNSYTGFEYQPTARLRWMPVLGHVLWGGVSRAVRMPTRFDTDLRFTAGSPSVVLQGSPSFQSETVRTSEVGYRVVSIPKMAFGVTVFHSEYDDLRSQEPSPTPTGLPITLGNLLGGHTAGAELTVHVEPMSAWQLWGGYAFLHEDIALDPTSHDATNGQLEHNDPAHQLWARSYADLPHGVAFDATFRRVGQLPQPVVPAYSELTLRAAHSLGRRVDVEIIGDNLLHKQHLEFQTLGLPVTVPRSLFVRVTWVTR